MLRNILEAHGKSAAFSTAKQIRKTLELLRINNHRQNNADVLHQPRKVPNPSNDLEIMLAEDSESPPENKEN